MNLIDWVKRGYLDGGADPYAAILAKFVGDGSDVTISHRYDSTDAYDLIQHQGGDRYISFPLETAAGVANVAAGSEFMRLGKIYIHNVYKAYADNSTGVTFGGAGWTTAANADTYRITGRIAFSTTAGDYIELTTDDGVTSVGAVFRTGISGGGVMLVTIDGDNTLADLLSTAQQLVDAGTLPNTVLVANGGTLNPTDRILDEKSQALSNGNLFSSSLAAGVHTVRITVTGYKIAAAANATVYVHGLFAWGAGLYNPADLARFHLWPIENVATTESFPVWDVSWGFIPTGAALSEWVGHTNSLKFITLPVIAVDGVAATPAKGAKASGQAVRVSFQCGIRHTFTGAVDQGTFDVAYTLGSMNGLTIAHTTVWSATGTIERGYPGMMLVNNTLDRGRGLDTAVVSLADDNDTYKANHTGKAMWLWDFDGELGALMYVPNLALTVNNFINAPGADQFYIDDDDAALWNKVRLLRFAGAGNTYAAGTTWQSEINYRVKLFTGGANAKLAAP